VPTGWTGIFRCTLAQADLLEMTRGIMVTRVLLADDSDIVRKSIIRLLETEPTIEIVAVAINFEQTIQMTDHLKPQIVVMDLHMPDETRFKPSDVRIHLQTCRSKLLAISVWSNEDAFALAECMGAVKLLDKTNLASELIPAIKKLAPPIQEPVRQIGQA
jgi:DNA-binding NarL/FixJ family response regulator